MKKLSEKTWNAFSVDSLFPVIEATKGKTTAGLVDGDRLPYIAAAKSIIGCKICSAEANGEWSLYRLEMVPLGLRIMCQYLLLVCLGKLQLGIPNVLTFTTDCL